MSLNRFHTISRDASIPLKAIRYFRIISTTEETTKGIGPFKRVVDTQKIYYFRIVTEDDYPSFNIKCDSETAAQDLLKKWTEWYNQELEKESCPVEKVTISMEDKKE